MIYKLANSNQSIYELKVIPCGNEILFGFISWKKLSLRHHQNGNRVNKCKLHDNSWSNRTIQELRNGYSINPRCVSMEKTQLWFTRFIKFRLKAWHWKQDLKLVRVAEAQKYSVIRKCQAKKIFMTNKRVIRFISIRSVQWTIRRRGVKINIHKRRR